MTDMSKTPIIRTMTSRDLNELRKLIQRSWPDLGRIIGK
jgi:hypothetical protein